MNQKIEEIILFLKKCYQERDSKNIDELMKLIYEKDAKSVLIGTSLGEICLTEADWRDLFLSDWEYWGNLQIDEDNKTVSEFGDQTLVSLHSKIEYVFNENENQYKRYLETIKSIRADEHKTTYQKACKIEWMLSHLLSSRDRKKRKHLLDLQIDMIFQNNKIRLMAFYFPLSIEKAEAYAGEDDFIDEGFQSECQNLIGESNPKLDDKINQLLTQRGYEVSSIHTASIDSRFYGDCIFTIRENLDVKLENVFSTNLDSLLSAREKLYSLRRDIAYTFKQYSVGDQPQIYVRIHGIFHLENGYPVIDWLQSTFPMIWILEDK